MPQLSPLVGLPADTYEAENGLTFHSIGDKYVRAVAELTGSCAVMIPSMIDVKNLDDLLDHFDGLLMTGAVSNIHPPQYGEEPTFDHEPYDHARDATTLKIIIAAIARGMPLFCICRGFQELNVAMGGSLETELQRGEGRLDHRSHDAKTADERYRLNHKINVTPGGLLASILGKSETMVNSIHRQGIKRLGKGLTTEAVAPDGVIEAISIKDAKGFVFGTQWHPEYKARENPDSAKLFKAYGDAIRTYAQSKRNGSKIRATE